MQVKHLALPASLPSGLNYHQVTANHPLFRNRHIACTTQDLGREQSMLLSVLIYSLLTNTVKISDTVSKMGVVLC